MADTALTPYLFFRGRCEEALAFYGKSLGAEVEMVMKYSDSPEPAPPGLLQAGFENKVMHASFRLLGHLIMASDGCNDQGRIDGFKLSLSLPNEAEARRVFDALADGGSIEMPLTATFWSPCFGMLTDRFGVEWMIIVPGQG